MTPRPPIGGGGAGHPNSLANLRSAPAAPAGNSRHRTHGGYAALVPARVDLKQRELLDALAQDAPLRDTDGGLPRHDTVAVLMLAKALLRLEDVETFLTLRGVVDDKGRERPAVDLERRLRLEVADALDALGMTPRSRARLGLDVARAQAFDLAEHWAVDVVDQEVPGA